MPSFYSAVLALSSLAVPASAWLTNSPSHHAHAAAKLSIMSASNIVLGPSEDPTAFDSLKIGSAKVHRYSKDTDPDSQTEYVMWYHGRSEELDADKTLPPLSTGRIGRATSRNGLHWVKDTQGSESEDMTGVSIGLNKESWWGFDTAHCGLGSVLLPMSTPAVLMDGGVYMQYYFGGSFDEAPIADFLENTPDAMKDATIKGMKMKIGVAVSQDGVSWGRVEGDDPSGACVVPFDNNDPNQEQSNFEEELYCGWPEVVVSLQKKKAFLMCYSTMLKDSKQKCIAAAQSPDGFRWIKEGVCLRPDEEGPDAGGCARCCVVKDAEFDGTSWNELASFTMYYEGVSKEDNKHRIMMAKSKDGKTWNKEGLVFDIGSDDSWDSEGVGAPHVIRMDDGTQRMYYTGQGKGGTTAIGAATLSEANMFVREQAAVTFA
ncbi:expressed unknown protein [Seminavis robusta]|uniref:Uncharacterized protein n=1 Tax=Seminavis robusta TaxID=568900 RepID=A0A9N8DEV3_9STRA|nr:expressed unknown protein [Seminavis robusta]|eukprot:Sro37_g023410.1 n/a (431) ;mRNA; f:128924-130396